MKCLLREQERELDAYFDKYALVTFRCVEIM